MIFTKKLFVQIENKTSIAMARDQYLTFASFPNPIVSCFKLPLKVQPKCEIFDVSDFHDYYIAKPLRTN